MLLSTLTRCSEAATVVTPAPTVVTDAPVTEAPALTLVSWVRAPSTPTRCLTAKYLRQEHLSDMTYSQTDEYATALLARVNKERVAHGLPVICSNEKLQAAAQRHIKDQSKSDFMSDIGTDDSIPEKRVTDAGYKWERVAENIDSTNADKDAVVDWWMRAQSRDNLLGNFTMAGSAYAYNKKYFWVQVYATGSSEECDTA
ncbi:unnamed protein product [Peronospora destructor]|uniref:SCP domain-containing protein n=1 Tax=Peronospora destructor TaxID=86335 RepID=A0AAV0VFU7_9STRA|nr:unnamed protein product [Peronospora destructor]